MKQELLEISDGKLYSNQDMARLSCQDCKGCSSCCQDMGDSIWLDAYDAYQLTTNLGVGFEQLLAEKVELHVEDGLILPNLRMVTREDGVQAQKAATLDVLPACGFLNDEGRCSIHPFRPGYCRLFPLGRDYDNGKLSYFVLKDACPAPNKSKVKINKWLGVPRIKDYEKFLVTWHGLTKDLRELLVAQQENEAVAKAVNLQFLQIFYLTSYEGADFYEEFATRMEKMRGFLGALGL